MLKKNGSWIYCTECNKTIAYLCYTTYQNFSFDFNCECGAEGYVQLEYPTEEPIEESDQKLMRISNRLCCPNDASPLVTIVERRLEGFNFSVTCNKCFKTFHD